MRRLTIFLAAVLLLATGIQAENRFGSFNIPGDFYSTNLFENMTPQAVFVVNTVGDQPDALPGDGFCNDGSGNCSLRGAIQETNAFPGANIIDFDIPGGCFQSIEPQTALPDVTDTVTINGYSQPGALPNTAATGSNANLCITLDGSNIPSGLVDGLRINAPNTVVRGLAVRGWTDAGIEIATGNGSVIEGNFIGTNISGTSASANRIGVLVFANNVRIGGPTLISRNIISGNTRMGLALTEPASANIVQNNQIGLSAASLQLGNGESGINIFRSAGNTIGGTTANVRNVISGNGRLISGGLDGSGVYILGDLVGNSPNNVVQGNYIGTDPTGTTAIPNQTNGVHIFGAINTTIGGSAAGAGNLVSGNNVDGIGITGAGATGNVVSGNIVGLDATRAADLGNTRDGVSIWQVAGNTVGGTGATDGNWIGGNNRIGVLIGGTGGNNNTALGNFIGFNVNGAARPQPEAGIEIVGGGNNTIGGTTAAARNYIAGNGNFAVAVAESTGNKVLGNYLGLLPNNAARHNSNGVFIQNSTGTIVGGTDPGARNVISGNTWGVRQIGGTATRILGNYIGTGPDGLTAVPNIVNGVLIQTGSNTTIGGPTPEARNVISGNGGAGISLQNDAPNNQVLGNYIGTKPDGLTALPNGTGIVINGNGSTGNVIGGTATGAGNVISGNNSAGVMFDGGANNNRLEGNIIGLKADGSAALPNSIGVSVIFSANNNVIGGTAAGAGNVISGNVNQGVDLTAGANATRVEGNKIGTDATGTIDLGNGQRGVDIAEGGPIGTITFGNTVGGATPEARNIISGNNDGGVRISGAATNSNTIAGNYIGATADGNGYLQNVGFGVQIESPNNTIGGPTAAYRNVISGHANAFDSGIKVTDTGIDTVIRNNYIGTNAAGNDYLFNGTNISGAGAGIVIDSNLISGALHGVNLSNVSGGYITNNKFGTTADGTGLLGNGFAIFLDNSTNIRIGQEAGGSVAPNVIAGGTRTGITIVGSGTGNLIRQNSIYDNAGIGIDLGGDGVTQNDPGDTDLANNLQNFPVIDNILTNIEGTLNSTPNRSFRLEFYSSPSADATGYGEGRTFITNTVVTTDGSGNATFSVPNPVPVGGFISATATDLVEQHTSEFSAYKQVLAPTAVKFAGARVLKYENGALVRWQTGFEADNLGFNIYRETKGRREMINESPVSGSALLTRARLQSGFDYEWFDPQGASGVVYYIEAVDLDGSRELFGAFRPEPAAGPYRPGNSKTLAELDRTDAAKTGAVEPLAKFPADPAESQIRTQNLLAETGGVRIAVNRAGFYRVPAADLFASGLPAGADPNNLALFVDGVEQPIKTAVSETGALEAVEFYGLGLDSTETGLRNYQLVVLQNPGRRLEKLAPQSGTPSEAASFPASVERRDRTNYFSGLLNGAEENFFGAIVKSEGVDQTLTVPNPASVEQPAALSIKLQGLTRSSHTVRVELNGQLLGDINFEAQLKGSFERQIPSNMLRDGVNTVRLAALGGAGDLSLVENIRLDYPRIFRAVENSISFPAETGQDVYIDGFTTQAVRVLDVTDAGNPFELTPRLKKGRVSTTVPGAKNATEPEDLAARSYTFVVTPAGGGARRLLIVPNPTEVDSIEQNFASNLRETKGAELLIITKRGFFEAAERLAGLRRSRNLSVLTVDVQDIYDEFAFGQKSTAALKNYLQFASANYRVRPRYVVLAGDATYDPKHYLGGNPDVVPTRLVDTLTMETASDEWFGDFANDGVAEFAIGRLPAADADELAAMVDKLIAYENQTPAASVTFVSDASDGFDFAGPNAAVREILPAGLNVNDFRRGDASDESVRSGILNAFASGQKIMTYVGHGSIGIWRAGIFTKEDAQNLTNADRLPILVTMTCLNGFFHDSVNTNLSEALLKNPNGGAVAVWTSTSAGLPDSYGSLNVELHRQLLGGATLGEAHTAAKRAISNQDVLRTWILLGDPSMRMR